MNDMTWQEMASAPKDGKEILIRYPLQGNVKALICYDRLHGCWTSKGNAAFPDEQKCQWMKLPED